MRLDCVMTRDNAKKTNYDHKRMINELIDSVVNYYNVLDSFESPGTLRQVADEFDFTHLKARKLLITAGVYHTDISDEVNQLKAAGKTVPQIMEITGLSRASVHSYLPYTKTVYNTDELSLNAERIRKYRERQSVVERIEKYFEDCDGSLLELVWDAIIKFDSYPFHTVKGIKFRYTVKEQEIVINRKDEIITRETVDMALSNVLQNDREVEKPEELKVTGSGYLYPIFTRLTIIR